MRHVRVYDAVTGQVVSREELDERKRRRGDLAVDGERVAPEFRRNVIARKDKRFVDHTLPRRGRDAVLDTAIEKAGAGWDRSGRPRFEGRRQIDETAARTQGESPKGGYAYEYEETR